MIRFDQNKNRGASRVLIFTACIFLVIVFVLFGTRLEKRRQSEPVETVPTTRDQILVDENVVSQNNTSKNTEYKKTDLKIDGVVFETFISDTPELREKGLSGWISLLPHQAMLFIFDTEGQNSFWMKDMNFPIDIMWLNKDFNIVHIEKSVHPDTYPESFYSKVPAKYVIELPANTIKNSPIILRNSL